MDNPITLLITLCYICYYDKLNITTDQFKENVNSYLSNCNRVFAMPHGDEHPQTIAPHHYHHIMNTSADLGIMPDEYLKKCLNDEETIKKISSETDEQHEIRVTSAPHLHHAYDGLLNLTTSHQTMTTASRCVGSKSSKSSTSMGGSIKKMSSKYGSVATISLVILYSLTIVLAILGNLLVIVVMCCGFRSSFLDISIYLMNLSIFNLLMAIFCIPFTFINTLVGKWIFSYYMCPFTNFIQMLSVNGCIFTLTALAINRFFAVAYPLKYNSMRTKRQKRVSLILVWIAAISISSIQLFIYKCHCTTTSGSKPLININNNSNSSLECPESQEEERDCRCLEIWDSKNAQTSATYYLVYTVWIFMQTYCIPVVILIIMYSRIISILRNRNTTNVWLQENSSGGNQTEQNEQIRTRTKKTIRMLCVVILSFCINWLPIHIFYLIFSLAHYLSYKGLKEREFSLSVLFFICHWLSMSNSFINPIIYSFMNHRFKTDLYHLLHCNKLEKNKYQSSIHRINELRLAESPSIHAHLSSSRLVVFSNQMNKAQSQILLGSGVNNKNMDDLSIRRGVLKRQHNLRHAITASPIIAVSRLTNNNASSSNLMLQATRVDLEGNESSVKINTTSCCELNSPSVIPANRVKSNGGLTNTDYKGSKVDL